MTFGIGQGRVVWHRRAGEFGDRWPRWFWQAEDQCLVWLPSMLAVSLLEVTFLYVESKKQLNSLNVLLVFVLLPLLRFMDTGWVSHTETSWEASCMFQLVACYSDLLVMFQLVVCYSDLLVGFQDVCVYEWRRKGNSITSWILRGPGSWEENCFGGTNNMHSEHSYMFWMTLSASSCAPLVTTMFSCILVSEVFSASTSGMLEIPG